MQTDVVVIGGGAAGLAAARGAKRQERQVVLISDGPLGGDCTFTGCVPSKALISAADNGSTFTEAMAKAKAAVEHIAATETEAVLAEEGVKVVRGHADLSSANSVEVADQKISAKEGIVLALGSKPMVPDIAGLDSVKYLTTETLWHISEAPGSITIVGAGAIGCELATAFAKLGVDVNLIDLADRVLQIEEPDASATIEAHLVELGVNLHLDSAVQSVRSVDGEVELATTDSQTITSELLLLAVGRVPNTKSLTEAVVPVELTSRGAIMTKDTLETSVEGIYAAGDCTGRLGFTHAADHMGRLAVANLFSRFKETGFDSSKIPWVTFCDPEVARIGMTEAEAAVAFEGKAMVAELPLTEHDRAIVSGDEAGFIKLISGPRTGLGMAGGGKLVGATIVAPRAGEMISELALLMQLNAFVGRLAQTVHPYPTWSYGIAKCAGQFFTTIEGRTARPAGA